MLASKDIVLKIIPQGAPMVMVDTLIAQDGPKTLTGFFIDSDNLFVEDGLLSEEGLIENMAQSAALRIGWKEMEKNDGSVAFTPAIGVIGSVKDFKLHCHPGINTSITTELTVQMEILNATLITGKIMQGDNILAEGELKIFLQK